MDEKTGIEVASLAGRVLDGYAPTADELKSLAASALTQAPNKGLDVKGYKPTQPQWAMNAVNGFKELEERVLRGIEALDGADVDGRFMAIGRTQVQQGFMAINRAIFQPQRVSLPEDTQGELFADDCTLPCKTDPQA